MSSDGGPYYAVANGRMPGIYQTWSECEAQVKGFSRPAFKKFGSHAEAQAFIDAHRQTMASPSPSLKLKLEAKRSLVDSLPANKKPRAVDLGGVAIVDDDIDGGEIVKSGALLVFCDGASKGNGRMNAIARSGVYICGIDSDGHCNNERLANKPTRARSCLRSRWR